MTCVFLESPYGASDAAGRATNRDYARVCLYDSLVRGEAPFPSHLLYPQVLDDTDAEDRRLGIKAGRVWLNRADRVAVYCDRGISKGMQSAIDEAKGLGIPIDYRYFVGPRGASMNIDQAGLATIDQFVEVWKTRLDDLRATAVGV